MRSQNEWLDASLSDPVLAPMATKEGENPGPTTLQRFQELKQLTNLLLIDYQQNSDDSEGDKALLAQLYETNILDLLRGKEPNIDAQTKIFSKFQAGDDEPLVLFLNLKYSPLLAENRNDVTARVADGLRSRECSPVVSIRITLGSSRSHATDAVSDQADVWHRRQRASCYRRRSLRPRHP